METKAALYAVISVMLLVPALGAWYFYADGFAESLSTSCGANCVVEASTVPTSVGLWLGVAVTLSVFSAASAAAAAVATFLTRSSV
ncbi:hypothetical protein [Nocardioides sp. SR21]|uniref:hypothetical protein n=1 Tax=Nocardioides sp. SR21 TaxID=2919501 RepID=UPI001FAA5D47|nr:hypothetical protein [Nocardioides sp. SR21]